MNILRRSSANCRAIIHFLLSGRVNLYISILIDKLWKIQEFREFAKEVVIKEHTEILRRLDKIISRLSRWWRLTPVFQKIPEEKLIHNGNITFTALKAPLRLIEYTGKNYILLRDELFEWANGLKDSKEKTGIKVISGPGGSGKTRLAVEFAYLLLEDGWDAFFIPTLEMFSSGKVSEVIPKEFFTPYRPTLYILDYADSLSDDVLRDIFDQLYELGSERFSPVAILLLMRFKPEEFAISRIPELIGSDVRKVSFRSEIVKSALSNPLEVPKFSGKGELLNLYKKARDKFIKMRGVEPDEIIEYQEEELPPHPLHIILLGLLRHMGKGWRKVWMR